jgi:uncharacterized membrane protein YjgN (DUF898 family)
MFIGFLIVMAFLVPFFLFIQFLFPALVARGKVGAAFGIIMLFYIALLYLGGFAAFRALRYRLSRTWWRGIRGGSDEPGWNYGGEYLGRIVVTAITYFIVWPWAATRLWNSRWNQMSFGPLQFQASMTAVGLKRRWAAVYLVPIALLFVLMIPAMVLGFWAGSSGDPENPTLPAIFIGLALLLYLAIPLMTLHWYAKFYRMAADDLTLGRLGFSFSARTRDWLGLFLGNIGLAIITLGLGIMFWGYRNWAFMVRHLDMHGEINVSELTQSTTHAPGEAEGLADAFDIGAI